MKEMKTSAVSNRRKDTSANAQRKKHSYRFLLSNKFKNLIRDFSNELHIPQKKLEVAIAATCLESDPYNLFKFIVEMSQDKTHAEAMEKAAKSILEVLRRQIASTDEDPLSIVDEATEDEIFQSHLEAEIKSRTRREKILAEFVPVEEAEKLSQKSRQHLEELRCQRKLIALLVRNRWIYPRWQFDPHSPDGIVPGLGEVLKHIQLSPVGAALWLTQPLEVLGNRRPIDLLKAGEKERKMVVSFAKEQGYIP